MVTRKMSQYKWDYSLRYDPAKLQKVVEDLELTDPADITWVNITLANMEHLSSIRGAEPLTCIPAKKWLQMNKSSDPEDQRAIRVYSLLARKGYLKLIFINDDNTTFTYPEQPMGM